MPVHYRKDFGFPNSIRSDHQGANHLHRILKITCHWRITQVFPCRELSLNVSKQTWMATICFHALPGLHSWAWPGCSIACTHGTFLHSHNTGSKDCKSSDVNILLLTFWLIPIQVSDFLWLGFPDHHNSVTYLDGTPTWSIPEGLCHHLSLLKSIVARTSLGFQEYIF